MQCNVYMNVNCFYWDNTTPTYTCQPYTHILRFVILSGYNPVNPLSIFNSDKLTTPLFFTLSQFSPSSQVSTLVAYGIQLFLILSAPSEG